MTATNDADLIEIIRSHSRELLPIPTGAEPQLAGQPEIRAVLFDVYGTLVISGVGDIGTTADSWKDDALVSAWEASGGDANRLPPNATTDLERAIRTAQQAARESGIEFPEIRIEEIWAKLIKQWRADGNIDPRRLAVEFEVRVNPTWPMPDARAVIDSLRGRGITLGIISNAQFFTPLLFPALFGAALDDLGFAADLRFYSYTSRHAKPGKTLYNFAREALERQGVTPNQVLYVGNDLLNDITPASQVGFRGALFAGDARSLRLREGHAMTTGIQPDLVITGFRQMFDVLELT